MSDVVRKINEILGFLGEQEGVNSNLQDLLAKKMDEWGIESMDELDPDELKQFIEEVKAEYPGFTFESIQEDMWSGEVATKWHPEEGFFNKGSEEIAAGLAKASTGLKQAMSRLNFYMNRAGKNMPPARRKALERVKEILRKKMGGKEEKEKEKE